MPRLAVASDASFGHFRLMVSGGLPGRYRGRRETAAATSC